VEDDTKEQKYNQGHLITINNKWYKINEYDEDKLNVKSICVESFHDDDVDESDNDDDGDDDVIYTGR